MRRLAALALCWAVVAPAAEIEVRVLHNRFEPEVASIRSGDTVTWIVERGNHDLEALDLAGFPGFDSGPLARGQRFSYTFEAVAGEVFYASTTVEGMQGAILIEDPGPPFVVDERVSSGWYDPAAPGQGVLFEYVPSSGVLVAYWFTFDFTGQRQLWLIGSGTPEGNRVTMTLLEPQGGRLDDPQPVVKPRWGELTVEFTDCSRARAHFNAEGDLKSGRIDLQRLYLTSLCQ